MLSSDAEKLWSAIVALKRSFDDHETNPDKFEVLKSDWEYVVSVCKEVCPERVC